MSTLLWQCWHLLETIGSLFLANYGRFGLIAGCGRAEIGY